MLLRCAKAKLRADAAQYGEVVGLTWGSRKGTCFLGMASPMDASKVILKMNEKSCLFPGHGTKTLKLKLDRDQGRARPDPPDQRAGQNAPRFAGTDKDGGMPPVKARCSSYSSAQRSTFHVCYYAASAGCSLSLFVGGVAGTTPPETGLLHLSAGQDRRAARGGARKAVAGGYHVLVLHLRLARAHRKGAL
jgi:hypothetical protein